MIILNQYESIVVLCLMGVLFYSGFLIGLGYATIRFLKYKEELKNKPLR